VLGDQTMSNPKSNGKPQDSKIIATGIKGGFVGTISAKSPFYIVPNIKFKGPNFIKPLEGSVLNTDLSYEEGIIIHLSVSDNGVISIDFGDRPFYVITGGRGCLEPASS
jgi:hypothetical protein